MNIANTAKSFPQRVSFWILGIETFIFAYLYSIKNNVTFVEVQYLIFFTQFLLNSFLVILSWQAWKGHREKVSKCFYFVVFASLLLNAIATEVWSFLTNIIQIKTPFNAVNTFGAVMYQSLLLMQIGLWAYLFIISKNKERDLHLQQPLKWLYLLSTLTMLIALVLINALIGPGLFKMKLDSFFTPLLEGVLFILLSVGLSRSINKAMVCIEMGFLWLILFNLIGRFNHLAGPQPIKIFEMLWVGSFFIILYGLTLACKDKDAPIELLPNNTIQVLINRVLSVFSHFIFLLFLLVGYSVFSLGQQRVPVLDILARNMSCMLAFTYIMTLLATKLLSNYLAQPLEKISQRIDYFTAYRSRKLPISASKINIYEFSKLEKFIMDTIQKLHYANRVKADFLMNMSHDFRTPTSGIHSLSRALQKRIDEPQLKQLQQLVVNASEQLMNCFEDILDYTRLESGQYQLKLENFDINSIIDDIILLLSAKAAEKGISLTASGANRVPQYCGDRLTIHRILLNLVSNAIKFTHSGSVTIEAYEQPIDTMLWLIIKVKDTGIGIDKAYHQSIFEPFSRVELPETAKYSGIGLGLSNVKYMLGMISGTITVKSELGKGSVFTVELPYFDVVNESLF